MPDFVVFKDGKKIASRMDDNLERAKAFFNKYNVEKKINHLGKLSQTANFLFQ